MVGKVLNTLVWLGTQQECKRNRELNQKIRRFIISENNRKSKGC